MYDVRYAIPAIVMLFLWLIIVLTAALSALISRVSPSALKQLANQLAPGRMATNFFHGTASRADASTSQWAAQSGSFVVGFRRLRRASESVPSGRQSPQAGKPQ